MMDISNIQILAGSFASLIFVVGHLPMLIKARRSKNLRSYSFTNLILSNVGNLFHWVYVASLPQGPIWILHSFYTVSTLLMLVWYLKFRDVPSRLSS